MIIPRFLTALCFLGIYVNVVRSQTCVPWPARQLVENPSFEAGHDPWVGRYDSVSPAPTYPSHSGSNMIVLSATYVKSAGTAATSNTSYTSQLLSDARSGITYGFSAFYDVYSYTKGTSCPDANLPTAACKLIITYASQTLSTIPLSLSSGYVEFSAPFLPETSGRYIQFLVSCQPAMDDAQCAEVIVLLDDVTFSDPGQTCGWTWLGCYTDSVSMRALNHHGTIAGWPSTTTVEACQAACQAQGFSYAGVEFGNECWCGNELSSRPATDGCNMPCSGNSQEICGGPDRLNVYYRP